MENKKIIHPAHLDPGSITQVSHTWNKPNVSVIPQCILKEDQNE